MSIHSCPGLCVIVMVYRNKIIKFVLSSLQGVTKDKSISTVLIPLSDNAHWCLIVVRIAHRDILHLDSLVPQGATAGYFIQCLRPALR